ncbi:DUF3489 domain-containing protein [Microvirga sp. 2YAF29]|uniref:DUF3489 domain-containing protein n=1 Tax=Microvirga sp. 2YAF29 TaxID=3233031 RepID=UPI003F9D01C7
MTRTRKLTDTQLTLLSSASQRDDGLLDLASRLKGNTLQSTAEKLLKGGLAEEVTVDPDQPAWRSDEWESRIGLKITPNGLQAIGVEPESETEAAEDSPVVITPAAEQTSPQQASDTAPRAGSKKALVLSLLQREEGATLDDLITATGWLPHTTRAALTGLRQGGHVLEKIKGPDGKAIYKIKPQPEEMATSQALSEAA